MYIYVADLRCCGNGDAGGQKDGQQDIFHRFHCVCAVIGW